LLHVKFHIRDSRSAFESAVPRLSPVVYMQIIACMWIKLYRPAFSGL
jgi:hypothetical protein